MEIDRVELKHQARERMALTDPKFWVVALTYLAMTIGVSWLISLIPVPGGADPVPQNNTFHLFFQLLLILYRTVVNFGLCLWALWTYRQLDPGLNSLIQGFSVAGRVLLMEVGIYLRILGWYFLIAVGLSIPMFILLMAPINSVVGMIFIYLFVAALFLSLISIALRYALAPYLMADRPDDGPSAPIYRSVLLMRGWKMQLFKLEFSYIGYEIANLLFSMLVILFFLNPAGLLSSEIILSEEWRVQCLDVIYSTPVVILSTLVTVPVSLWLLPYRAVARAGFYDARILAASQEEHNPQMPPL